MILGKKFIDCTECKDKMEKLSEKTDAEGLMQNSAMRRTLYDIHR